jgi:hypothetical protein
MRYTSIFVVFLFLGLAGCASSGKHLPEVAMQDPAQGVSVEAPEEMEENGVKEITTFTSRMDPGLWTEVVYGSGVWPALARTPQGELKKGYAYLAEVNYWGDFLLRFVFAGEKGISEGSRILYFNRDAGWAYTLKGEEVQGEKIKYHPEQMNDAEYQEKLFHEFGMTMVELDDFWRKYLRERGAQPPSDLSCVQRIKVGDNGDWKNFKKKIVSRMQHKYKMGDERIRVSYLPEKQFKEVSSSIPGFDGTDRFVKRAKLPLVALPFTGVGAVASSGASVLSSAVSASIDDDWSGFYGRAKSLRYELAPNFRALCRIYKNLLRQRDQKIRELQQQKQKASF